MASVSTPSNIAEGRGRASPGECRQFLGQARGSLFEVETQLEVALRLKLISAGEAKTLTREIEEISRMLTAMMNSMRNRQPS